MRHADRMLDELKKTGKTYTIVQWGHYPSYYRRDYTDAVITKLGNGNYQEGRKLVEFGNDAPRGGALGNFIKLKKGN